MEAVQVLDVKLNTILTYLEEVSVLEEDSKPWVRAVVDSSTATILLSNGKFSQGRQGYAAYLGDAVVGYAIVDVPNAGLDILHIHPEFRRRGIAEELILATGVRYVTVQQSNHQAISLYEKLGLEIDFDEAM